ALTGQLPTTTTTRGISCLAFTTISRLAFRTQASTNTYALNLRPSAPKRQYFPTEELMSKQDTSYPNSSKATLYDCAKAPISKFPTSIPLLPKHLIMSFLYPQ